DDDEPVEGSSDGTAPTAADTSAPDDATERDEGPGATGATDAGDTTSSSGTPDSSEPAASGPVLRLDGIGELDFGGTSMDVAVQQISDVLGFEESVVVNDECPAGPTQIIDFGGVQLLGMDG